MEAHCAPLLTTNPFAAFAVGDSALRFTFCAPCRWVAAPFGFSRCDEDILGAIENLLWQTGQARHLDAVALVRAARDDLAEENDLLVPFPHRDVVVCRRRCARRPASVSSW